MRRPAANPLTPPLYFRQQTVTPTRWKRVQEVVSTALELPQDGREAFVEDVCGPNTELRRQIEDLIDSYEQAGNFFEDAIEAGAHHAIASNSPAAGDRIGAYELAEAIGQGGMGSVYRAIRADDQFRQQVAIKIIHAGMGDSPELLARFRAERQILATLVHPNIARLLDGGVTASGLPYLVMEFIEGATIDRFARDRNLSIRERLALFRPLCAAVQFAHQNLVVHRDLKPANVIVTSTGEPKLLDFGIAKLLEANALGQTIVYTRAAERLMTPEYASPEQLRGETITTATDVYGLGVLLYELLTGKRPFETENLSPAHIERLICETPPERPSTRQAPAQANRSVVLEPISADLDNIVLKAMHKDPARRYASPAELSEDLRRYLEGFPISARPDSLGYRVRKFTGRHKLGVAAAAVFTLAITGLSIGLAIQADHAKREAQTASQIAKFLASLFKSSRPDERQGRNVSAREILDRGADRVSKELSAQPFVEGQLLNTLGTVYYTIGALDRAEQLIQRAYRIRTRVSGAGSEDAGESLAMLGLIADDRGEYAQAARDYDDALRIFTKLKGRTSSDVASLLNNIGLLRWAMGDFKDAEAREREAIAINERMRGPEAVDTLTAKNNLETVLADAGEYGAAESLAREILAARIRTLGPNHPHVGYSLNNIAFLEAKTARWQQAEATCRQALELRRKVLGQEHLDVAASLAMLAWIEDELGRYPEALALNTEALRMGSKFAGPQSVAMEFKEDQQGLCLLYTGDFRQAREFLKTALAGRSAKPSDPQIGASYDHLGMLDYAVHDLPAARRNLQEALQRSERFYGHQSRDVAQSLIHLGEVAAAEGDRTQAIARFRDAIQILRAKMNGAPHTLTAEALFGLGKELAGMGQPAEARACFEESLAMRRKLLPPEHPDLAASAKAVESDSLAKAR